MDGRCQKKDLVKKGHMHCQRIEKDTCTVRETKISVTLIGPGLDSTLQKSCFLTVSGIKVNKT